MDAIWDHPLAATMLASFKRPSFRSPAMFAIDPHRLSFRHATPAHGAFIAIPKVRLCAPRQGLMMNERRYY